MAWNRSDRKSVRGGRGATATPTARKSRVPLVLAVLAVLAVAAVGVWWAMRGGGGRGATALPAPRQAGRQIAETTPAAAPAPAAPGNAPAPAARPRFTTHRTGPTNKVALTRNVKPPTVLGCNYYECVSGGRPLFSKPIFTNSAENIIGGLLSARPGERFVPVELGDDFDNDFVESLKSPILTTEDDTHEIAVVKEAVSKAKEMIADGMAAGQKPSEVITSMRDEMNRIADYRDMLQEDFDKMKETGSAEKIMAYLKEANMLLDEFGAEHLDLPEDEIEEINKRLSDTGQSQMEARQ